VDQLRPGRLARDAWTAAVGALAEHGFQPSHYAGHQLGATVNEDPRLVAYDETTIQANMVFAVEPGVYAGPEGTPGAPAGRDVPVTADGPEILPRFRWGMADWPTSRPGTSPSASAASSPSTRWTSTPTREKS